MWKRHNVVAALLVFLVTWPMPLSSASETLSVVRSFPMRSRISSSSNWWTYLWDQWPQTNSIEQRTNVQYTPRRWPTLELTDRPDVPLCTNNQTHTESLRVTAPSKLSMSLGNRYHLSSSGWWRLQWHPWTCSVLSNFESLTGCALIAISTVQRDHLPVKTNTQCHCFITTDKELSYNQVLPWARRPFSITCFWSNYRAQQKKWCDMSRMRIAELLKASTYQLKLLNDSTLCQSCCFQNFHLVRLSAREKISVASVS